MSRAGRREWAGVAISVPEEHSAVTVPRRKTLPPIRSPVGLQGLLCCLPPTSAQLQTQQNEQALVWVISD